MHECNNPEHLTESEKYDIIALKVFDLIKASVNVYVKEYLDDKMVHHVYNKVQPMIIRTFNEHAMLVQKYLENNSLHEITNKIKEFSKELDRKYYDAMHKHESLKSNNIKQLIAALEYYLSHECGEEDYD